MTFISGLNEYVSFAEISAELGIGEEEIGSLVNSITPKMYSHVLHCEKHLHMEDYLRFKDEFLKYRHTKKVLRQAIGLIAVWDALEHGEIEQKVSELWSKTLGTKIYPANVLDMLYRFILYRQNLGHYTRPDESDFEHVAESWNRLLQIRISPQEVEKMLGQYAEQAGYIEPVRNTA